MASIEILIVDDDALVLESVKLLLKKSGYRVYSAANGREALNILQKRQIPIMLTDLKMPKMTGIELLRKAKEVNPDICIIMMTAYATVETAVEAMKLGAYDYITKPFSSDELKLLLKRAREALTLRKENQALKQEVSSQEDSFRFVANHPAIKRIVELLDRVKDSNATILLSGETGTGKEVIARYAHYTSNRRNSPFITVNCAALPANLLESELFGHEKGSFTGAVQRRLGKFELANNGTLLLDEISEMDIGLQAKLLRALQEGEFDRVGGSQTISVDVRVIATTNRDLEEEVKSGRFRQDLFFRLSIIPIELPPLRNRKEDIPLLVRLFIDKYSKGPSVKLRQLSPEAMDVLINYEWPGNIRELENYIQRLCLLSDNAKILPDDLIGLKGISWAGV